MNGPRSPRHAVLTWMKMHVYENPYINATQLVEAVADQFDEPGWLDDETHWVWEDAIDVINFCEGDPI